LRALEWIRGLEDQRLKVRLVDLFISSAGRIHELQRQVTAARTRRSRR
jgi:hypothetical protein